jgi:NACHT domain
MLKDESHHPYRNPLQIVSLHADSITGTGMTTLEALQRLPDGQFHLLCDELLRRHEPRYRSLRSHGINDRNESIVGQPDSYVGDTSDTCRIAFCYTTKRDGWWTKVVEDVELARKKSPNIEEVVCVITRDKDREGPKKRAKVAWLTRAKTAACGAAFHLYDGPEIARLLDDRDNQDLRHDHLGIPYSRRSFQAILAGCRDYNNAKIDELHTHGRFDPDRYLVRAADRELFQIWQRVWPRLEKQENRLQAKMIALVSVSGMGKTSLLCTFVKTHSPHLPVLFVQGRDISFDTEDCIVRFVVQAIQGVLSHESAKIEEAAIVHQLERHSRLTLVLDGLDEVGDPAKVKRAVGYWLNSRLSQQCVLIVSSRPESWNLCFDVTWVKWMLEQSRDDRGVLSTRERKETDRFYDTNIFNIPGLFSPDELQRAWVRAGRSEEALYLLSPEVRGELAHPFTLRAFLDLCDDSGWGRNATRAKIIDAWLKKRLLAEEDMTNRLTLDLYRKALRLVVLRITESGQGWVSIDCLDEAPRFDRVRPPGPVIERLLRASVLESLPGRSDRIRFVFDYIHDFLLGEIDAENVTHDPQSVARSTSKGSFSESYLRLVRLGESLLTVSGREAFLDELADRDPIRAAIILQFAPPLYPKHAREKIVGCLKGDAISRYRARAAFAVSQLGRIDCAEARLALLEILTPLERCPMYLRIVGTWAFIQLSCIEAVSFVYALALFGPSTNSTAYYFRDLLALMRDVTDDFRMHLGDYACDHLDAVSGAHEHARAVCVLAHLGDERLVPHLEQRFESNGTLLGYENHALIALGSKLAAELFAKVLKQTANLLAEKDHIKGDLERRRLAHSVSPSTADVRYLISPFFEAEIERLMQEGDNETIRLCIHLSEQSESLRLLQRSMFVRAGQSEIHDISLGRFARLLDPRNWMLWWKTADSDGDRRMLLYVVSDVPSIEVEQTLIDCLDNEKVAGLAAHALGRIRSHRASARLRQLLEISPGRSTTSNVMMALGNIRDTNSVEALTRVAEKATGDSLLVSALSLGAIGTEEAEKALVMLLESGLETDWIVSGLLLLGSQTAVNRALDEARMKEERGPRWLATRLGGAFCLQGWTTGCYYTYIHDETLVEYLMQNEQVFTGQEKRDLINTLDHFDSENVRGLLRLLASREGSDEDEELPGDARLHVSHFAYRQLLYRGDSYGIDHFVAKAIREDGQLSLTGRELVRFQRPEVAKALREALLRTEEASQQARIIHLMGFYGSVDDSSLIRTFVDCSDDRLANEAQEAHWRLSDPLLILPNWSEP